MPDASNKFDVHCDICGEPMQKQADVYACYPCKHMIWESELWQYDPNPNRSYDGQPVMDYSLFVEE